MISGSRDRDPLEEWRVHTERRTADARSTAAHRRVRWWHGGDGRGDAMAVWRRGKHGDSAHRSAVVVRSDLFDFNVLVLRQSTWPTHPCPVRARRSEPCPRVLYAPRRSRTVAGTRTGAALTGCAPIASLTTPERLALAAVGRGTSRASNDHAAARFRARRRDCGGGLRVPRGALD